MGQLGMQMGFNKEIVSGEFAGSKGKYSVSLVEGDVVASISYSSDVASVSVSGTAKSKAGLEELKVLIPGMIDDAVISVIEAALDV